MKYTDNPADDAMKWSLIDSEYLFRRPWLTVRRDTVRLPNGTIHPEYYVLEYPKWINVLAITADGEYVMVKQYRHGLGVVATELCAGVVEEGEDPLDGAKRELLEETGYAGGEWELSMVISANPGSQNNLAYCYTARGVEKVAGQNLDETEDISVVLLSEDEVRDMLVNDDIKQALMAAPLWKHFALKDKECR
ncbi:MAG: NUDIX hydrolase [Duncaniella sp.]|nr:NUDIX hydrolase [Duncaniella sp.]